VRFYRIAERKVAEMSKRGIVCYVSSFSFLMEPTFVVMRQRLIAEFDTITIDCMNGDSRSTGKRTPAGDPDPSLFSTAYNREGIQAGTAICLLAKGAQQRDAPVQYRDFWGSEKRSLLLDALANDAQFPYKTITPTVANRYSLIPHESVADSTKWPELSDLCAVPPFLGLNENRRFGLIDVDSAALALRMRAYFDPSVSDAGITALHKGLMSDAVGYVAAETRGRLLGESEFDDKQVQPMTFRPFDNRWFYCERRANLWNRSRPELLDQTWVGNEFLYVRCHAPRADDGTPAFYGRTIADQHALHKDAYLIPFRIRQTNNERRASAQNALFSDAPSAAPDEPNVSSLARDYLTRLGIDLSNGAEIFNHALAIMYSPRYVVENADAIRFGWPRIPLPESADTFLLSATLGRNVAAVIAADSVLEVTPLRCGAFTSLRRDGKLRIEDGDLKVTAGWGHVGKNGATMPGSGRIRQRPFDSSERQAFDDAATGVGPSREGLRRLAGDECVDVYLNDWTCWKGVPLRVWRYTVGGYQILKKWLSYRDEEIIKRPLTKLEARQFGQIATRIAMLALLEPDLDENYVRCSGDAVAWKRVERAKGEG
jgi:hypothetical protein